MRPSPGVVAALFLTLWAVLGVVESHKYDTLISTSDMITKCIKKAVNHIEVQKALEKKYYLQGLYKTFFHYLWLAFEFGKDSIHHKYNHSVWSWFQNYKDIQINLLIKVNTDNRCMYKSVCKIHAKIIVTSILNIWWKIWIEEIFFNTLNKVYWHQRRTLWICIKLLATLFLAI